MIELNDADLLNRLKNTEATFVERKTASDHKDWLKTVVAFANSTPIGYPAVLFIGAKDDGTIENGPKNLDSLQKTFNKKMENAYPTIYYLAKVLSDGDRQCLAIVVPGSDNRPHFAGQSYVRVGSETWVASVAQFDKLVAERQSKPYEILQWKGKQVLVEVMRMEKIEVLGAVHSSSVLTVVDCNTFYVTLQYSESKYLAYSLHRVNLSFDTVNDRLKLEVTQK